MTDAKNPLDVIEAQLDLLDRAVSAGHIEALDIPHWTSPPTDRPLDRDRLIQLLDRIEVTIEKVGEARQHIVDAQAALSRRREIARLYANSGA